MALRVAATAWSRIAPFSGVLVVNSTSAVGTNGVLKLFATSASSTTPPAADRGSAGRAAAAAASDHAQEGPEAAAAHAAFTFEEPLEPLPSKAFYFEEPLNSASLSDNETENRQRAASNIADTPPPRTFYFDEPLNSGGVSDSELDSRPLAERIEEYELRMAEKLDSRVRGAGFVGSSDAIPSPQSAGMYGGPGTAAMADMVDMVGGAFGGEKVRVAKAVRDLSRGAPGPGKSPRTPSQAWPRASLQPEGAQPDTDFTVLDYCMKNRARGL